MDDGRVRARPPPRQAWADAARWLATGVGIPDLVRLAHAVPDAFPGGAPLSVDEAVERGPRDAGWRRALERAGRRWPARAASVRPTAAAARARRYCHWDDVSGGLRGQPGRR